MKISPSTISLSICIAFNVVSQSALASPAKYNILIEQMAQAGPHRVQMTEEGVKVEAPRMEFGIQYHASDNIVTLWSYKHHTYYTLPYEKWISSFRNLFAAVSFYSELVKPAKATVHQKDHLTYHVFHYHVDAQSPSYWSSDIGHKEAKEALQDFDFTTVELPSKHACKMMEKIYGTPSMGGYPYSLFRVTLNSFSLRTNRLVGAYTKPISFFVPTAEYKKIPFTNQIIGPSLDDNMTKMMLPY